MADVSTLLGGKGVWCNNWEAFVWLGRLTCLQLAGVSVCNRIGTKGGYTGADIQT